MAMHSLVIPFKVQLERISLGGLYYNLNFSLRFCHLDGAMPSESHKVPTIGKNRKQDSYGTAQKVKGVFITFEDYYSQGVKVNEKFLRWSRIFTWIEIYFAQT